MFVLMGTFQSFSCGAATTDYAAVKANFTALAELIAGFTRIKVSLSFTPSNSLHCAARRHTLRWHGL